MKQPQRPQGARGPTEVDDRKTTLAALAQAVRRVERSWGGGSSVAGETFSSSCPALDALLPQGGLPRGALVEWLTWGSAGGAGTLAWIAARQARQQGGAVVVLDRAGHFYPPAAAAWGIDLNHLIVVRAATPADEIWALDQALRCRGVAAAWIEVARLEARWFRRLQLAAEQGGGTGLLVRPAEVRHEPTWSALQLLAQPRAGSGRGSGPRLRVQVARCRGAVGGETVELEMDDVTGAVRAVSQHETPALHPAAELAHSASGRLSARA